MSGARVNPGGPLGAACEHAPFVSDTRHPILLVPCTAVVLRLLGISFHTKPWDLGATVAGALIPLLPKDHPAPRVPRAKLRCPGTLYAIDGPLGAPSVRAFVGNSTMSHAVLDVYRAQIALSVTL